MGRSGRKPEDNPIEVSLDCPACGECNFVAVPLVDYPPDVHCKSCSQSFRIVVATVRSKKSRGHKEFSGVFRREYREFDIRLILPSGEEIFKQFTSWEYEDHELRAKDVVILVYGVSQIHSVHNITISDSFTIQNPPPSGKCYIATYIYGAESTEVELLRSFRDKYLLPRPLFRGAVALYYDVSPKVIERFGHSKIFQMTCGYIIGIACRIIRTLFRV